MTIKTAALDYAARGWHVMPLWGVTDGHCDCGDPACRSIGKHPIGPLVGKGLKGASTDPLTISGWFDQYPNANVGIRTGEVSGLWVVDIDPKNGGDKGQEMLLSRFPIADTLTATTGSGGTHLFFLHPGIEIPNRVGVLPGIDIRLSLIHI